MAPAENYTRIYTPALLFEKSSAVREWSEQELQAHWFGGGFGREFTTTDGRSVRVVQFGVWNHEAGPDFAEAAVALENGEPQRGSIELDTDARDWEHHGHATNEAYDGVVLHVFLARGDAEFFTRTTQYRLVPQVLLDASLLDGPPSPQPAAKPGLCLAPLRAMSDEKVREVLLGAAHFRLRRKAAELARLTEVHGADEALYQSLATALGYKSNKLPFTLLAQRLPLRLLRAAGADAMALLFGVAGFLDQSELGSFDTPTRAYLRGLWERWWPRRAEFERLAVPRALWKMGGQRPMNHPQRRLAALAQLVRHWPRVRALRVAGEPAAISAFCAELRDEYWDHHYTVTSRPAAKRMALIGESRATEMLANVFHPLAIAAEPERWAEFTKLPATLTNRRVETAALRLFGESPRAKVLLKSAAIQQGLLQIYEDFCQRDASDCERCLFPAQMAQW